VCRDGWCYARTLRLVGDLLDACSTGETPQRALCRHLAEALHVSAAFHLRIETGSHRCTSFCWPYSVETPLLVAAMERLVTALHPPIGRSPLETPPRCLSETSHALAWRASVGGLILWDALHLDDLALMPVGGSESELSIVCLVSDRLFTAREMHLLCTTHRPLASVHRLLVHTDDLPAADGLTARETEVLRMLAEGMLASSIAARLQVSTRTVHKHLGNVYRKLGTHDRLQAVMHAQELGIVPAPRRPPVET
jgi:DNA-binding CsgD family transcriptional regulator